jgi:hypothetical protein
LRLLLLLLMVATVGTKTADAAAGAVVEGSVFVDVITFLKSRCPHHQRHNRHVGSCCQGWGHFFLNVITFWKSRCLHHHRHRQHPRLCCRVCLNSSDHHCHPPLLPSSLPLPRHMLPRMRGLREGAQNNSWWQLLAPPSSPT